ncbi:MAG: NUDIX hydrolase [Acidimicrobiia bacterium]|nr:NUDIX hydrolase [Acidimicrobiia bacterium]
MDRPTVAVGAVIVQDGSLLLVERANPPGAGKWAVPGGAVEPGETLADAVVREVREETGLAVTVGDLAWAGDSIGPGVPPAWHFTILDFWATSTGGMLRAGDDAVRAEWVPIDELASRPMVGTMYDLVGALWPNGAAT